MNRHTEQRTLAEIEELLQLAERDEEYKARNARTYSERASMARDAGRESDAADNEGLALYWERQRDHAEARVIELRNARSAKRNGL
jgi:hypothetical protein